MANPSKKGVLKAEGTTLTNRPDKKPATKAAAPKLAAKAPAKKASTAKKATAKVATTTNEAAKKANPAQPATKKGPTKKTEKKEAAAKATAAATKATPAPVPKATLSGEKTKPRANTSRKRRSSSIDDDEVAHAAKALKKFKAAEVSKNLKRKATADADEEPKKAAKITNDSNDLKKQKTTAKAPAGPAKKSTNTKSTNTKSTAPSAKATAIAKTTFSKPTASKVTKARKAPAVKLQTGVQINFAPTQSLDIFIFGSGESGELGLGNAKIDGKKPVNVKRPRIHPLLSASTVGVVQIACGGMHSVALTKDNKILTWGVNDQGALGRNTTWDGGLRDADADDDDNGDDFEALNPVECTPAEVSTKNFLEGTKFVKVVASDSASFALTEDGRVYGWGTFRVSH